MLQKNLFHANAEKILMIATSNESKIKEISEILNILDIKISIINKKIPQPPENGSTFLANSLLKAKYYAKKSNKITIADDSGLVIPSINDMPGIYSARWAKNNTDFQYAFNKIYYLLKKNDIEDLKAYFICIITLYNPKNNKNISFTGKLYGAISFSPKGIYGMGYDPIFIPKGYKETLAQIIPEEKNKISHRKIALHSLAEYIKNNDIFI